MKIDFADRVISFLQILKTSVDSPVAGHTLEEGQSLLVEFDLRPQDHRLSSLSKIIPGKWRPPATYHITSIESLSDEVLQFLQLSKLQPRFVRALGDMEPKFAVFAQMLLGESAKEWQLTDIKTLIFEQIAKRGLSLREVASQAQITEMSLHNYKKKFNLRLDTLKKF